IDQPETSQATYNTVSRETPPSDPSITACPSHSTDSLEEDHDYAAPPLSPASASSSSAHPPPFSSLFVSPSPDSNRAYKVTEPGPACPPALAPPTPVEESLEPAPSSAVVADTKASFSEPKNEGSADDSEPPPPYTEGYSPLVSFTYVMAAAGGASSIITQVSQTGGPPINTLGDIGGDENICLELRNVRFTLSRDELLTLPEFVLLSLFPNGLLPDGHATTNGFHDGEVYPVDYDPAALQYMLDFFRNVAQTIPSSLPSGSTSPDAELADAMQGSARDMLQDRAGIIVLREDLDFYRAAGRSLLKQDGIFSGLRKSEEIGSTEQHLIEMLTAGGFDREDQWGHRAAEPNKAVICSLALAKLRTDIRGDLSNNNAVGMAQKLLLFWRKPARRCWWEGIELDDVEGVDGQLKVWIRRVWTLEMVSYHSLY
ncbi:Dipeptidyl-peptidase 3, partial [Penicillium brevicompactum]